MTMPPFGGGEMPPPYQPPGYVPPGYPPPGFPPTGPVPGFYGDPLAPYGRHPLTGEPYSDKSKLAAGLLQLIGLFGILGIGRLYLGYIGLGIAQLVIGIVGGLIIGILTCGVGFLIPVIWAIVDSVMILSDKVRDPQGRPLRDN